MEIEKVVKLINSLTGLDEQLVKNSLEQENGETVLKNVFSEKFKVMKVDDFNIRESNLKSEALTNYKQDLIERAKKQELPQDLYNAVANNIISKQNKTLAKELNVEVDDFTNSDALKKAVIKKYSKSDLNDDLEHVRAELQKTKDLLAENEVKYQNDLKRTKIDAEYIRELNGLPIDFDNEEELTKRRTIADSVFKSNFQTDLQDGKIVVMKDGEILKDPETRAPLTLGDVFQKEISAYVPLKKERTPGRVDDDAPTIQDDIDGVVINSLQDLDIYCDKKGIKRHSQEHVDLYNKFADKIKD